MCTVQGMGANKYFLHVPKYSKFKIAFWIVLLARSRCTSSTRPTHLSFNNQSQTPALFKDRSKFPKIIHVQGRVAPPKIVCRLYDKKVRATAGAGTNCPAELVHFLAWLHRSRQLPNQPVKWPASCPISQWNG